MSTDNKSNIKSDLKDILVEVAKSKGIKHYKLRPNSEAHVGDGFVAHFYMGDITDTDSGEITNVAIKKAPLGESDFSAIFKNESSFYTKILPALTNQQNKIRLQEPFDNVPEFYYCGSERKKEYLAMENLKSKGYVLFDKKKYWNKEHLEFIFKTYGKFHALSFVLRKQNFKQYQEIHREYTDLFAKFEDFGDKLFNDSLATAIDALDSTSKVYEEAKELSKNIKGTVLKAIEYSGQYRCSTHGDCWSNNMLFKYSEDGKLEDMKLIDFQMARDGSPIHDLSYFFYSGACKSDLNALEEYLQIYHKTLSEVIKHFGEDPDELFSFDTLIKEWKENALLGILMGIYLWQIKLLPKEECEDYLKSVEGVTLENMSSFETFLSKTLESDAYKERTSALLVHAYEIGILRKEKFVITAERSVDPEGLLTREL